MTAPEMAASEALARDAHNIVLHARNVTLTLGSNDAPVEILKGIDLDIKRGESLAILGASGSGKSSMMALLTGLEQASGGEILLAGQNINGMDEDQLAQTRRGRIGVILQAFHLLPTMTALENVMVPLELDSGNDIRARASDALEKVGLGHRMGHYPTQLSGGEQQRVAIARAIVSSPDILFADEPTGNLDQETGEAIIDILFERHLSSGTTLVIITHDAALARRCNRIITMRDGQIVDDQLAADDVQSGTTAGHA
ncbi:ABC transporter ATP-binding protein [Parasphingorhabdus sp. DH2-15]|uniref:ABC transporter ATP-binding protein n=1 Tax=Parasphingorhabdus sp. DH2-15 TaxID=3444112 RepID=UPI003F688EBB